MLRLVLVLVCFLASLRSASLAAADRPQLRNQCVDGTSARFIDSTSVPLETLSNKLPSTDSQGEKPKRDKLIWGALPPNVKPNVEKIAEYRGQEIHRAVYEWEENGSQNRCMLLAYRDQHGTGNGWWVRPFYIAYGDDVRGLEAGIVSTVEHPFMLETRVDWSGNGVMWQTYSFLFDRQGPYLFESSSGGRGQNAKTDRYQGNAIRKTWVDPTN